jgi:hypothetical protein
MNITSNIRFIQHKKSSYYNSTGGINDCIDNKNVFNELLICNILNDNKLLINDRKSVMDYYSCLHGFCHQYKDMTILCLDNNFNIKLCNSVDINTNMNVLDCVHNNILKENVVEEIKKLYDKYCMGCNYKQF